MKLRITGEIYGRKFEEVLSSTKDFQRQDVWQRLFERVWPCEQEREKLKKPLVIDLFSMKPVEE